MDFPGETTEEAAWYARFEKSLKKAGFKVTRLSPEEGIKWKIASRRRDRQLIEEGLATPEEIQRKNPLFSDSAGQARIIDYGGLDEET
ncbi:MAG: hypothetical protein HYY24_00555 [Verrucomicrobia bacterium]|nr:hypothetical protein [Verrucomicrobiota bacterium]